MLKEGFAKLAPQEDPGSEKPTVIEVGPSLYLRDFLDQRFNNPAFVKDLLHEFNTYGELKLYVNSEEVHTIIGTFPPETGVHVDGVARGKDQEVRITFSPTKSPELEN